MYLGRNNSVAQRGACRREAKGLLAMWTCSAPAGLAIIIDSAAALANYSRGWHVIFNKYFDDIWPGGAHSQ